MSNLTRGALFALVLLLPLGACGDDDDGGTASGPEAAAPATAADTVSVASTDLGDVLVDAEGRTLYLFTKDTGDTSTCAGACASTWPALTSDGDPSGGDGVDDAKLARNGDGQVVYGGHPLYRYAQDAGAGDVKGEGVGGVWFAVDADGQPVQQSSSPTSSDDMAPTPSY